jgi:hypothetical protein
VSVAIATLHAAHCLPHTACHTASCRLAWPVPCRPAVPAPPALPQPVLTVDILLDSYSFHIVFQAFSLLVRPLTTALPTALCWPCFASPSAAGSILWRKEFGGGEPATGLAVDPLDRRRLVLCCARGTFIVLWWVLLPIYSAFVAVLLPGHGGLMLCCCECCGGVLARRAEPVGMGAVASRRCNNHGCCAAGSAATQHPHPSVPDSPRLPPCLPLPLMPL